MDKWDHRFLELAKHVAQWSKDPSTKVGSVIVENRRIVSVGFNGFASGVEDLPERYSDRDTKYAMVTHAEANAIIFAKRDLVGCEIYVWPFLSCTTCTGLIIQSSIWRIVAPINDNPRWAANFEMTKTMCKEASVEVDLKEFPIT